MSRYVITANDPRQTIVVGHDPALCTYFATVTEDRPDLEDDNVVLWIGGRPRDCLTLDDLATRLAPYADVPPDLRAQLERDRAEAPPPSPLQREMMRILEGGGGRSR